MRKRKAPAESRLHPFCPECGYDLVGTFAAGSRRCPECGRIATPDRPGDESGAGRWTPWIGARHAAATLIWRAAIAAMLCAGLDWFLTPALSSPPYWRVMLVLAVSGLALGWALSADINAEAGFSGPGLALLVSAFAWAAVIGGVAIAYVLRPPPGLAPTAVQLVTGVFATLWIVKVTVME